MTEYSHSGDPRRSLELLWGVRAERKRGPKARLSVAEIVAVATEIADEGGLGALSMRRVAEKLGVATMSLYTYVPTKAELLDVMLDAAYGELPMPAPRGNWRGRLERVARDNFELLCRHPWMLRIAITRPVLGPNRTARYDYELATIDGIGLSDVDMDSVLTLVLGHAQSAARIAVDAAEARAATGVSDEQWWAAHAELLATVIPENAYPLAERVGTAAGMAHGGAVDARHAFEFGLRRILDGVARLIE